MATPPNQPPQQPRPPAIPEPYPEPATVEDLHATRRWLWVVAIWAVAASVIALIALIDRPKDPEPDRDAARIGTVERRLSAQIEELDRKVAEAPSADDLTKLQSRVERAEESATKASSAAESASDGLSDLENRVDELETRVDRVADQQKDTSTP